jgi:hypothetical protein
MLVVDKRKVDRVYTSHFNEGECIPWKGVVFRIKAIDGETITLEAVGPTKRVNETVRKKMRGE